jgi:hypothetical protein
MADEYRPKLLFPGFPVSSRILTWVLIGASLLFVLMALFGGGGVMMGVFGGLGLFVGVVSLLGEMMVKRMVAADRAKGDEPPAS